MGLVTWDQRFEVGWPVKPCVVAGRGCLLFVCVHHFHVRAVDLRRRSRQFHTVLCRGWDRARARWVGVVLMGLLGVVARGTAV